MRSPVDPEAREILEAARAIRPWLVELRRDFHRHPELGWEEQRTSRRILEILEELEIEARGGVARTGVLATLRGRRPGRTVALRADIDALPIQDVKDVPYRSQEAGRMHACGHDVHTTVALGAARLFAERRDDLVGSVRLIFEPAEESDGGAQPLVDAGALENPDVDAIFGLHVEPILDLGTVGLHPRQRNAANDDLHITIAGSACHGAYPSAGVDAIVVASQVVSALQSIVSRNVDARDAAVVTIGTIRGGTANNIVAGRVEMLGTIRTVDEGIRETVARRIRETVEGIAAAMGASADVRIEPGYAAVINDPDMIGVVRANAQRLLGPDRIREFDRPNMGAEDFSAFLEKVPGAYYSLGVRNAERGIVHPLHHEHFDVDEDALVFGVALQVLNVLDVLNA